MKHERSDVRNPWIIRKINRALKGRQNRASPQISFVVFNSAQFQQLQILLLKTLAPVVVLLIQNITPHSFDL